MNININYPLTNTNFNIKYKNNFKGNLVKTANTIKLTPKEILQVSEISNKYKQLDLLFKAAGNYMTDLFKKGISFLLPIGTAGFIFKNALISQDTDDVKIEQNLNDDELMTFTLREKNEDVARLIVSKSGKAEILTDDELPKEKSNKFLHEIQKNHGKLYDSMAIYADNALNSVGEILNQEQNYDFDLTNTNDMQKVVKQFIDQKKRIALLSKLIYVTKFMRNFEYENDMPHKLEEGILPDSNISFSFSNLENKYFDGMRITAVDYNKNIVQGFVAMPDGNIHKTREWAIKDGVIPRVEWGVRKLFLMTQEELNNNSDLKNMFHYAYSHTDKMYRGMMNNLYEVEKKAFENYQKASTRKKGRAENNIINKINTIENYRDWKEAEEIKIAEKNVQIGTDEFDIAYAKIAKNYNLTPEQFEKIQKISEFNDKISKSYCEIAPYLKDMLTERLNITRKKYVNGFVFNDMLTNKDFYLGVARYTFGSKRHEVINFGIFDKDMHELARFKVMPDTSVKLMTKPTDTIEFANKMEQLIKTELNEGLLDKLISRMDDMCFYHENISQVNRYIEKYEKYSNISALKAIDEIRHGKKYYQFNHRRISQIKDNIAKIKQIYDTHNSPAYRWQNIYFENAENVRYVPIFMRGILTPDNYYDFTFIDNENCAGLKISIKDKEGNFKNCYVINYNGNVYNLIQKPSKDNPKYVYLNHSNLQQMDAVEVRENALEFIIDKICNETEKYRQFLEECSSILDSGRYKIMPAEVKEIARKYKNTLNNIFIDEKIITNNTIKNEDDKPVQTKRRGRPRKKVDEYKTRLAEKPCISAEKYIKTIKTHKSIEKTKTVKEKEQTPIIVQNNNLILSNEFKNLYASMLKPNGEFKSLSAISLTDLTAEFDRIFATPYEERSPHLIHERLDSGRIFEGRFSVIAPDGAKITVSRVKSPKYVDFLYYSIRIQKDKIITYINIDPENGKIIRSEGNKPILKNKIYVDYISKSEFIDNNPICVNIPMYLKEIFIEKKGIERKVIKFQVFNDQKTKSQVEKRAIKDFEQAMNAPIPKSIQEELQEEINETNESHDI